MLFLVAPYAHAQLITDSEAKLRSLKIKKERVRSSFSEQSTRNSPADKYLNASTGKRFRDIKSLGGENLRYSTFMNRFIIHKQYAREQKPYDYWVGHYRKVFRFKKTKKTNMHPSSNHIVAKGISNKFVRKSLRKWNVFWVRLNDQKHYRKGTGKGAKKLKFDRKEKNIWHNERERRPSSRDAGTAETEILSIDDTSENTPENTEENQ